MWQRQRIYCLSFLTILFVSEPSFAAEPNENFGEATILGPGVLSVSDNLTTGFIQGPDTYLGTLGFFGNIELEDDDNSLYGDGYASGLTGVPINPGGTINFLVTGCCDLNFTGDHFYSGEYEVIIEVYDFFGDVVENISEIRTMTPGVVEQFDYFGDENWLNGSYDINIDNLVGDHSGGDVDFYTFTGLAAGATFSAEITQNLSTSFDSVLGWFDETGLLIEFDDDDGEGVLSLIAGTVPASGELTFAVTGYDDFDFVGSHDYDADYNLELTIGNVVVDGDFDGDTDVDGRDFLIWQRGNSPNPFSFDDLSIWQENYDGTMVTLGGAFAVPEPTTMILLAFIACSGGLRRQPRVV